MSAPDAHAAETLEAWLTRLERLHVREIDLGLERVRQVWRALGAPRPGGRVITVAGTNGKGSTIAALDALLRAHGFTTGATTSPHLLRFNERIMLDGVAVEDAVIVRAFERIEEARQHAGDGEGASAANRAANRAANSAGTSAEDSAVSLTYFEFGVLAALLVLAESAPDFAILEVGLGGRLDAINIIDADLAVITAIDLDHQDWLGDDREAIGAEKAGIMRAGQAVIVADRDPPASIGVRAAGLGAVVHQLGVDFDLGIDPVRARSEFRSGGAMRFSGLPSGPLHPDCVAAALRALLWAQESPAQDRVLEALRDLRLPGRMQQLQHAGVEVLLDVAHNPHAARGLVERLPDGSRWHVVLGLFKGKDAVSVTAALAPVTAEFWLADTIGPRGMAAGELAVVLDQAGDEAAHCQHGAQVGLPAARHVVGAPLDAFARACAAASASGERVLVCGSFSLVGTVLAALAPSVAGNPECSLVDSVSA